MRYYLDTNMLIFILQKNRKEVSKNIQDILDDYSTILYAGSTAIKELVLLYRIGKISFNKYKSENDILDELKKIGIEIVFFNQHHLKTYASLKIIDSHKDMNDHAIIAQSIADKIPVISSDGKFKEYANQGLKFVYNKR